jgi:hypothetical protein
LAGALRVPGPWPFRAGYLCNLAREADYNANGYVRDDALFLARAAEAHLALGNVGEACGLAHQALTQNTDIDSARPAGGIAAFRRQLQPLQAVPEARDFLELSRQ